MLGYLEKGIQTPMAQGRSTEIIRVTKWIRTSRLSLKHPLSGCRWPARPPTLFDQQGSASQGSQLSPIFFKAVYWC